MLARLAAAREAAEETGGGGGDAWRLLSSQYEGGLAHLSELVISRCFYCKVGRCRLTIRVESTHAYSA